MSNPKDNLSATIWLARREARKGQRWAIRFLARYGGTWAQHWALRRKEKTQ